MAERYGHVGRNVAALVDPPKIPKPDRAYLTADQAKAVFAAAADDRMRARYWLALYLGMRQGEILGLRWIDLDLDAGTMNVRQQLQRLPWKHGCQNTKPEPGRAAKCGQVRGDRCPQRTGGGITTRQPKSRAGRRSVPPPPTLVAELNAHHARQAAERLRAGTSWHEEHGLVFCQPDGKPLDPAGDWRDWRATLVRAGVPAAGTHAARRTAVTLLIEAGVDARTVAEIVGHSSPQLTVGIYQQTGRTILAQGTAAIDAVLGGQ